jgi:Mce-associated membrane protein
MSDRTVEDGSVSAASGGTSETGPEPNGSDVGTVGADARNGKSSSGRKANSSKTSDAKPAGAKSAKASKAKPAKVKAAKSKSSASAKPDDSCVEEIEDLSEPTDGSSLDPASALDPTSAVDPTSAADPAGADISDRVESPGIAESEEFEEFEESELESEGPSQRRAPVTFIPADASTSETTEEDAGPSTPKWTRASKNLLAKHFWTVLIGVIAVALAVALVLATLAVGNKDALESARTSALAAAKTYAVEIGSYNYAHLDQDFAVVLANSTPTFKTSYTQSSGALKSTLVKYKATAKATVVAQGLSSSSTTSADVLVFLDQTVTNTDQKSPTTTRTQVEIDLLKSGGKWLINDVTVL